MRHTITILALALLTVPWCQGQTDEEKVLRKKILFYCDSVFGERVRPAGFWGKLFRKGDCLDFAGWAFDHAGAILGDSVPFKDAKPGDLVMMLGYQDPTQQIIEKEAMQEGDTSAAYPVNHKRRYTISHAGILARIDTSDYARQISWIDPVTGIKDTTMQDTLVDLYSIWIYDQNPNNVQLSEYIYPPMYGHLIFFTPVYPAEQKTE